MYHDWVNYVYDYEISMVRDDNVTDEEASGDIDSVLEFMNNNERFNDSIKLVISNYSGNCSTESSNSKGDYLVVSRYFTSYVLQDGVVTRSFHEDSAFSAGEQYDVSLTIPR
ncbi:hypothetical protein EZS27_029037 [termite gut metagenome]|uniref:Uncharacterized protein n=1 Tax=termite gut metagenome TaxID=433724 RepID=A0A5J4QJW3_9ZZZZ